MKSLVLVLALLGSEAGLACTGDSDCGAMSTCVKVGSSIIGVCTISPLQYGDKKSEDNGIKSYSSDKAGDRCMSSFECGPGGKCIKVDSAAYGVCTK